MTQLPIIQHVNAIEAIFVPDSDSSYKTSQTKFC